MDHHEGGGGFTFRAGVVTLSDKGFRGERADRSGPLLVELLKSAGARVELAEILPDDEERLVEHLIHHADSLRLDLIATTGGTGLAPGDITPEATARVISRIVPGIGEMMRAKGMEVTPRACLSRGIAGVRGGTLIVNFPGSPGAVGENFEFIRPVLHHAIELIRGEAHECGSGHKGDSIEKG